MSKILDALTKLDVILTDPEEAWQRADEFFLGTSYLQCFDFWFQDETGEIYTLGDEVDGIGDS